MAESNMLIHEEPWNDLIENYMRGFIQIARNRERQHRSAGYHFKARNTQWGLPLVLIPVVMSPISLIIENESLYSVYINAGAFLISGVVAGVYSFFRYGEKMEKHFGFACRYCDLVTDIEAILIRGRSFREPADVCSMKCKMILDNLILTEPTLPQFILNMDFPLKSVAVDHTTNPDSS